MHFNTLYKARIPKSFKIDTKKLFLTYKSLVQREERVVYLPVIAFFVLEPL